MSITPTPLEHAFLLVYHQDKANAAMHCAPVRFSPITFRLAEVLERMGQGAATTAERTEVSGHAGRYAEDPGR